MNDVYREKSTEIFCDALLVSAHVTSAHRVRIRQMNGRSSGTFARRIEGKEGKREEGNNGVSLRKNAIPSATQGRD